MGVSSFARHHLLEGSANGPAQERTVGQMACMIETNTEVTVGELNLYSKGS